MREIKFRFWSNHLNKFVIPDDSIFVGALKDPDMNPMQFTGLTDKNGVEIYELDIISDDTDGSTYPITWNDEWGGWGDDKLPLPQHGHYKSLEKTLEVIGNIYSNPEFLDEK